MFRRVRRSRGLSARRKQHPPLGARPGTLVLPEDARPPTIHLIRYRADHLEETACDDVAKLPGLLDEQSVCWIDVCGLGDEQLLRKLAELFSIHPLALEDTVHIPQRPKIEHYPAHLFCVTRMMMPGNPPDDDERSEQVSFFVGRNYVLTFQEQPGDVFDPVRNRIRQGGPILRSSGAGYLFYALLDAVIDGYFPVVESFGDRLEALEDSVTTAPDQEVLTRIRGAKRDLVEMRRAVWPQREAIASLLREENPLINETVRIYLRDCYDHCVQLLDLVETYREMINTVMELYLSTISQQQNEVMRILTVMASIFIPLTFIAGVYGMNFKHMPELDARWAYPVLWLVMIVIAGGLLAFFWHKGWIGRRPSE